MLAASATGPSVDVPETDLLLLFRQPWTGGANAKARRDAPLFPARDFGDFVHPV
jgi:hypothetical protein